MFISINDGRCVGVSEALRIFLTLPLSQPVPPPIMQQKQCGSMHASVVLSHTSTRTAIWASAALRTRFLRCRRASNGRARPVSMSEIARIACHEGRGGIKPPATPPQLYLAKANQCSKCVCNARKLCKTTFVGPFIGITERTPLESRHFAIEIRVKIAT